VSVVCNQQHRKLESLLPPDGIREETYLRASLGEPNDSTI
jgi:hypothetical protein